MNHIPQSSAQSLQPQQMQHIPACSGGALRIGSDGVQRIELLKHDIGPKAARIEGFLSTALSDRQRNQGSAESSVRISLILREMLLKGPNGGMKFSGRLIPYSGIVRLSRMWAHSPYKNASLWRSTQCRCPEF